MKDGILTVLLISFLIGVILAFWLGPYDLIADETMKVPWLIGNGIAFLIFVTALPVIISVGILIKNKKWPRKAFVLMNYVMLVVMTAYWIIINWNNDY